MRSSYCSRTRSRALDGTRSPSSCSSLSRVARAPRQVSSSSTFVRFVLAPQAQHAYQGPEGEPLQDERREDRRGGEEEDQVPFRERAPRLTVIPASRVATATLQKGTSLAARRPREVARGASVRPTAPGSDHRPTKELFGQPGPPLRGSRRRSRAGRAGRRRWRPRSLVA